MSHIQQLKTLYEQIFNCMEHALYVDDYFRTEITDEDGSVHHHMLSFMKNEYEVQPEYSYIHKNTGNSYSLRIDIDAYTSSRNITKSYIGFHGDEIVYCIHPRSMDHLEFRFTKSGKEIDVLPAKEFLTEENIFMYSTLYDVPEYEVIREFLVMIHKFRPYIFSRKLNLYGTLPKEIPNTHIDDLMRIVG